MLIAAHAVGIGVPFVLAVLGVVLLVGRYDVVAGWLTCVLPFATR